MFKKFIILFVFIFSLSLFNCGNKNNDIIKIDDHIGQYKTEYVVFWNTNNSDLYILYSNDSTYVCSFQGTNYLLEMNNKEEIFSTTAPIKIKYCRKIQ